MRHTDDVPRVVLGRYHLRSPRGRPLLHRHVATAAAAARGAQRPPVPALQLRLEHPSLANPDLCSRHWLRRQNRNKHILTPGRCSLHCAIFGCEKSIARLPLPVTNVERGAVPPKKLVWCTAHTNPVRLQLVAPCLSTSVACHPPPQGPHRGAKWDAVGPLLELSATSW